MSASPYPKIELHVHLEATIRPERLLELGRRNDVRLPARTTGGLERFCRFSGFDRFIVVWVKTTSVLRHGRDFREIVVDYAAELAAQGCFYAEPLFSPSEPVSRGAPWQEVFEGYCDGADEARERHGVELRFTPDITRNFPPEVGEQLAGWAVRFRDRGVAGISLGGSEHRFPPAPFARAFAIAREGGLKAAPHAGETAGPASIRSALDDLHADRLRHGVRAVEDPALLAELAGARRRLRRHAGEQPAHRRREVAWKSTRCRPCSPPASSAPSGATTRCSCRRRSREDADVAVRLGHTPRAMYEHAVAGAFCDEPTRARLKAAGDAFDWAAAADT